MICLRGGPAMTITTRKILSFILHLILLILVMIFFTGNGEFIYEAF